MIKMKHKMQVQQSKTYPGADKFSDRNVVVMKYKLQRNKKIYKPALNNSKWTVNKLREEKETENCKSRIKQNFNYTERERQQIQINNGRN